MVTKILLVLTMTIFLSTPVYALDLNAGDETEPVIQTERNEENNCQVNIEASMPDNFNLDLFVDFMNDETGTIYRLYALNKNDYKAYLFVPDGSYSIIECSVYGDTINKYPLNIPESFTLSENDIYTIKTSLVNEDMIKREVEERLNREESSDKYKNESIQNEQITNDTYQNDNKYDAETNGEIIDEPLIYEIEEPLPWRKVIKTDTLEADVSVTGLSKDKYDIIIKIVKTGEVNEAEFIYSLNGGKDWSNNQLLKSSFSPEKTGLTFKFPSSDTKGLSETWKAVYKEGDTIEFHSFPEVSVTSTVSKGAVINAYMTDTVNNDYQVEIKIMRTGDMETALFGYSLDGGSTYTGTNIPVSEEYCLNEIPVVIQFTDLNGQYVVNDAFSFEIKGKKEEKDTTCLLYLLCFIAAIAILIWYMWLISLKEKDSTYRLNVYVPYNARKK